MLKNTEHSYGWPAVAMHWLMAVLLFAMFALGVWMVELNYDDRWYHDAPEIHKSIGMLLLLLLCLRLSWRWFNIRPELAGLWWEQCLALVVHRLHYVLMAGLMLSGYLIPTAEGVGVSVFGWFSVPALWSFDRQQADWIGEVHRLSAWAMLGLSAVHAAAAVKHHIIDRDMTLLRMLGSKKTARNTIQEE